MIQKNYIDGLVAVIEVTKKKLCDNLKQIIDQFTDEDKLEQAFDVLIRKVGKNPMLASPFSWASMRTRNSLDDLK